MWGLALLLFVNGVREDVKYYFADFVHNPLFAENFVRKGGEGVTPQIRNLFFGPKSGVFEQKTPFLALFEEFFLGKNP